MSTIDDLKKKLEGVSRKKKAPPQGLSSGSTLLNLALSGDPSWGFSQGSYYLLVGQSSSGKTWLSLSALAEAANSPLYDNYRLVYDAPERGARMDMKKFFGSKMASRLEWKYSSTVEDFYYSVDDCIKEGTPFIYVEDSESSLSSEVEKTKFDEQKTAYRKGKEVAGSYGDGKAKKHSSNLRQVVSDLDKSGSILFLVSQSRDNIGFGAQLKPETRSGGRALTFYATAELWFKKYKPIKKRVNDKDRKIGNQLRVKVEKNRGTGVEPIIDLHHYFSVGFDDLGANIQYLIDEGRWKGTEKKVSAPDFEFNGSRESLILQIQEQGKEKELKNLVTQVWEEVMSQCGVERKSPYQ